ncbi:MAG TPA: isocitrate lyase ICL2 [Candidatus Limnocylindria bacterium]|nr:isocitrate lyase ICL2 [Candidatus Limnocylindria bacterium]
MAVIESVAAPVDASSVGEQDEAAKALQAEIAATRLWMDGDRFSDTTRLHTARQVVEQRGTITTDYPIARAAADKLHARLRELFEERRAVTTFGPYSPGQAVAMKRAGIEAIYLGGWATSAKGSADEDPGPDLASYPLGQVPDEAAGLVRALLTADRNQRFARSRMTDAERQAVPEVDFSPMIIADADTGHGGDAHVRNLIRRFVEAGVPGYHIEDQKPGAKKCGHQGGKVLVPSDEQIKRLNAARFQLDVMGVAGIVVARTDAEAANLLDGTADERDQPFLLGVTNREVPSYKVGYLAILRRLHRAGATDINGHLLYAVPDEEYAQAEAWLEQVGLLAEIDDVGLAHAADPAANPEHTIDTVADRFLTEWQSRANLKTYGQAVADAMAFRADEGIELAMSVDNWLAFAATASGRAARSRARDMGLDVTWDPELAQTPEGYYQVEGGIPYAIAKSLAAAPFADVLWMETKTADLADARAFAEAIHAVYPDKMLAYNLSPSFNWDTTGMTDEEMRQFPEELARLGYVFNFITYGGHQIDGLAAEEFTTALLEDGMLALARLQRRFRLLESPYRTPQTLVGGPRADAALLAASGQTATTKAMGVGSTQAQHLVQTEVPPKVLAGWLASWAEHHHPGGELAVSLRPHTAGSDVLELSITDQAGEKLANVVFTTIADRRGRTILSVRDQNIFDPTLRRKRLMTLLHLFLIYRYRADSIHYLVPTDDNRRQCERMLEMGILAAVADEVGDIIVAEVGTATVQALVQPDSEERARLVSGA